MSNIENIKKHFVSNKKYYISVIAAVLIFALGFTARALIPVKVAMVDVQKIVNSSAAVNALKVEHQGKIAKLQTWLSNAEKEIEKETISSKKEKLTKKYQQELNQKQQAVQQAYAQELQKIDALISEDITKIANKKGYNLILVKGMVISGADDITEYVIEGVR